MDTTIPQTASTAPANTTVAVAPRRLFSFINLGTPYQFTADNIYPPTINLPEGEPNHDPERRLYLIEETGKNCPICLEAYSASGEQEISLRNCKHHLGFECAKEWFRPERAVNSCPLCNVEVFKLPENVVGLEVGESSFWEPVIRHCYAGYLPQLNRKIIVNAEGLLSFSAYVEKALRPDENWDLWNDVSRRVDLSIRMMYGQTMTLGQIAKYLFEEFSYGIRYSPGINQDQLHYWETIVPTLHSLLSQPGALAETLLDHPQIKWLVKTVIAFTYAIEYNSVLATPLNERRFRDPHYNPETDGPPESDLAPSARQANAPNFGPWIDQHRETFGMAGPSPMQSPTIADDDEASTLCGPVSEFGADLVDDVWNEEAEEPAPDNTMDMDWMFGEDHWRQVPANTSEEEEDDGDFFGGMITDVEQRRIDAEMRDAAELIEQ